ncbi:putative Ubiquitin-protein ligase BRE1A [Corchorus olitorius]|uniref:Ubiquitin-protein ligase BRE1A n=1 Tax=Corchorus olitorius TaxID=93759 RepID=A0A1R3JW40_9ROSI|nr:putative Ubiquitin-protein ligase BRE1A [Corchorus olitorius]
MAKKKLTHQSKEPKEQNPSQETHETAKDSTFTKSSKPLSPQSSMEDPNEKLKNLKSLNAMLLKETVEKRQQIESLVHANEALEAELSKRKGLDGDESEKAVNLELQNGLLWVYMDSQMKEMGVERERAIGAWKSKNYGEAMDREAEKAIEIGALVEDKRAKERSIERLLEEKDSVSSLLNVTMAESEDRQRRIEQLLEDTDAVKRELEMNEKKLKDMVKKFEELLGEKNEIEKVKLSQEKENVELHKEVTELKNVVHRLQEACGDHEKKNKELISEVNRVRNSVDQVTIERDNALKGLDEEKQNSLKLTSKVSEVEKMLAKTAEELAQKRAEWQKLIKEKEEIESHFGSMTDDKDRLQKDLLEANKSINDLRAKMESTSINYDRALTLLKNTASSLCQSKDENGPKLTEEAGIAEQRLEAEIEPYAAELEAIKQAYRNKESLAQDLKQKVVIMEKSMVEAEKKKSFWTLVTSATTLLAAISVAYAARGR